jgi:signal transduction histidine kinase/ActR/RegA family two-component response regulator
MRGPREWRVSALRRRSFSTAPRLAIFTSTRASILAVAGLALVLVSLAAFELLAAESSKQSAARVERSTLLSSAYGRARNAILAEDFWVTEYLLKLGPEAEHIDAREVRREHARKTAQLVGALNDVRQMGSSADRQLAGEVLHGNREYVRAAGRLFAAVDAGNEKRALAIELGEIDPVFPDLEKTVKVAAAAQDRRASQRLHSQTSRQGVAFIVTLAVVAIGLVLVAIFSALLIAYSRRLEAGRARELDRLELERANKAKTDFLSRVSHELRTPLNAILGFGQLLEGEDLSPKQHQSVDQILKGGRHLLELINEVLEISRIEAGNLAISLEPVHVEAAIAEVLELVRAVADKHNVSLEGPPEGGEHFVEADKQRLKQVLLNLLSNAVKYNREGGAVTVSVQQMPLSGRLGVLVSDTGQGIPEDRLADLFRPFERLGAEGTSIEGTGLGLALSKALVEAMGGILGVESSVVEGTTFSVELALVQARVDPLHRADTRGPAFTANGAGEEARTVLHIEDNLSNFQLVEQILANRPGVELLGANEGHLGLELAMQHHPDLILLDLHLPGMPGEEILKRLKSDPDTDDIPVIVLSADATESRMERLHDAGADAYLRKPLDVRRFLAVVDEVLGRRAAVPAGASCDG